MKPIKLEMKYFGPFERESIDFNTIKNSMFLISGKTGSGKTMIFDAITYALYGTLSTSDRMEGSVRSQFATENDISSVKLTFEIRGRQYTVERTLSYHKEGRKTPVPPKAALYDADGEVIESSINGVKNKVLEIIKVDSDQFRQILILPQGEFKRLLVSSSESKQEILRTLFRTERFVHFELRLNELKKEKMKEVELVEGRIEELFKTLSSAGDDELESLISAEYPTFSKRIETIVEIQSKLKTKKEHLDTGLANLKKETKSLADMIHAKEQHNMQVEKLIQTKKELEDHERRAAVIKKMESGIQKYKKVRSVEYELRSEQDLSSQRKVLENKKTELIQISKEMVAAELELEKTLEKIETYKESYNKYQRWINDTERFIVDSRYVDLGRAIASKTEEKEGVESKLKELSSKLEAMQKENETIEWDHEESEKQRNEKSAAESEINKIQESINKEKKNVTYDEQKEVLQQEVEVLTTGIEKIDGKINQKRESISSKYSSEDRIHIEHLVSHLRVGEACPVCRQTVATMPDNQEYLTEEEEAAFKNLEMDRQNHQVKLEEAEKKLGVAEGILDSMERYILSDLEKDLKASEGRYKKAQQQIDLNNDRYNKKQQLAEQIKELENTLNSNKLELNNLSNTIDQLHTLKNEFVQQTGFENQDDFKNEFNARKDKVERYEIQQQEAEQKKQLHRERKFRLEENKKSNDDQLKSINDQLSKVTPVIDRFISENNSEDRQSLLAIIKNTDIENDERQVESYYTQKNILQSRMKDLEAVMETVETTPVNEEKERLSILETEQENKTNDAARLDAQIQHNENIRRKITEFATRHEEELGEINELVELVNAVSGKNEQKISLERFVLTYYLDRILYIANIRLLEMTSHRYELRRSTGRSNRKTGLDIEVFDFYNNRARHISSLSGGETFQASLTLALALNEALQQESGGISLDTMLIDEGFGTLDPETLDMAINTLIELQTSGKMVGIISHVEELKERMENILEVKAVNERSTANFK